jgi:hypothetical protein
MCTAPLPPGGYPIAVSKYIISYHIISYYCFTNYLLRFFPFSDLFVPTNFRCAVLLLHLITLNDTHTHHHHTRSDSSGRVIGPSQRHLPDNTRHSKQTFIPPAGFEPTIPASERPQTHALDCAATCLIVLGSIRSSVAIKSV